MHHLLSKYMIGDTHDDGSKLGFVVTGHEPHLSYSLHALKRVRKGIRKGSIMGVITENTASLGYGLRLKTKLLFSSRCG